jgi:DinB superfamily
MNCYGAKELAASFLTVRKNTLVIAEEIGEDHYSFRATPDTRTIGETLVHIAGACRMAEQIHGVDCLNTLANFDFMGFMGLLIADEKKPRTKAEIIALLKDGSDRFSVWISGVSDEFLAERVEYPAGMMPPSKTRFEMLLGVKEHEMHHRGQLMLLQRMVGGVPHLTRVMQERMAAMAASAKA